MRSVDVVEVLPFVEFGIEIDIILAGADPADVGALVFLPTNLGLYDTLCRNFRAGLRSRL